LEVIKDPVKREGLDRPIETLGITEAGRALLRPPLKPRKTIPWHREPKGPGDAVHMFIDAGGERVELLAYGCGGRVIRGRTSRAPMIYVSSVAKID
jgi:hypothetical protein